MKNNVTRLINRFMLKSLGQWTAPSFKPRKIIPSQLTVVPSKPPADKGQGEPSTQEETEYVAITAEKNLISNDKIVNLNIYKYLINNFKIFDI